jgi:phage shock protein A
MEMETGDLGSKLLGGGVWTALGVFLSAVVSYWKERGKEKTDETFKTLGAINKGSETLMTSLLQSHKQMDEQLRRTRKDLQDTDAKLDDCERKHADAERRIEDLERRVSAVQPVAK